MEQRPNGIARIGFAHLADKVVMVELDKDVAAVWQTIRGDDNEWLAD